MPHAAAGDTTVELEVDVFREFDNWPRAKNGALSTWVAIGTDMSIMLMAVQSWKEESRFLRSKDISPYHLLFLNEAARLDAKSIATVFELCERLEMQLIIAASENISLDKGTTYKLVCKPMCLVPDLSYRPWSPKPCSWQDSC